MIEPVTLQSISILISSFAMVIALVYYTQTLRNTAKARQRELIHQKVQILSLDYMRTFWEIKTWNDWETVEEFNEKYGMPNNPETMAKFSFIIRHYGMAGTLLKENMANADLIFQLYPVQAVMGLWEQFEALILDVREKRNNPTHGEGFEFLYKEAKRRYPEILPRSTE